MTTFFGAVVAGGKVTASCYLRQLPAMGTKIWMLSFTSVQNRQNSYTFEQGTNSQRRNLQ